MFVIYVFLFYAFCSGDCLYQYSHLFMILPFLSMYISVSSVPFSISLQQISFFVAIMPIEVSSSDIPLLKRNVTIGVSGCAVMLVIV